VLRVFVFFEFATIETVNKDEYKTSHHRVTIHEEMTVSDCHTTHVALAVVVTPRHVSLKHFHA